jgi:putative ABC transport system permease protein
MMFYENFKMALVSLRNAKLRSFLTMLGIIIGVAAVVSILAIGAGVKKSVQDQITGVVNANAIAVASGKINLKGGSGAASSLGASTLTLSDVASLAKISHVQAVAPMSLISGSIANGATVANNELLLATTPAFSGTQSLTFDAGRFLEAKDSNDNVAVLGGNAKQDLFGSIDPVGRTISIRGAKFVIIGTLKTTDSAASSFSAGPSLDNAVYIPLAAATKLTSTNPPIVRILVQIDNSANVNPVATVMNSVMLKAHGGQDDFTVLTQKDILATVDTILSLLTTFIVSIASSLAASAS